MAASVNADLVVWCCLYLRQSRESDIIKRGKSLSCPSYIPARIIFSQYIRNA